MTHETESVLRQIIIHFLELEEAENNTAKQFADKQNYSSAFVSSARSSAFYTAANEIEKFIKKG